jgi:hypothetical protein
MKALEAWQTFHGLVMDLEGDTLRDLLPRLGLGSDWGATLSEGVWQKALISPPHMRALIYRAMTARHGADPTQGVRYL